MAKSFIEKQLVLADIKLNGSRPWDIKVHNNKLLNRILSEGSLGLGESYMEGWWDCSRLDIMFEKLLRAELDKKVKPNLLLILRFLRAKLTNLQSIKRAFHIGKSHYDLGNDIYQAMLDKRLTYTCGYWNKAKTLDKAQEAKLDLVCKKIRLKKGMKVLDIGCGWGSFAKFAAEKYKVSVVGVTVSKEQVALGRKLCKGLPVEIKLQDYRDVKGKFDRIVSLGMIEHVGVKNYRKYMEVAHTCLKDNGMFLLHTIGSNRSVRVTDPWISKYIFTNSMLPSIAQIGKSIENLFVMEDWHNFGADYDKTLMCWHNNFKKHWPKLKKNYSNKFYRMWTYYLLACAGSFRARKNQLWQIVLTKKGVPGGHETVR